MKVKSTSELWITFFAVFMLLAGIFAAGRIAFNIYKFGSNYPQAGVLALNFSGQSPYFQTESNCTIPIAPAYDGSGKPVPADTQQMKMEAQNKKNCLAGIAETREQVKWVDIGSAAMLLFVSAGILVTHRFFFS